MDNQQNGEEGQEPNSLATAAAPKQKRARSDTTLASFMGKSKPKDEVYWDDSGKPTSSNSTQYSDVIGVLLKQSRRFQWQKHWDKQDDDAKDWLWAKLMVVYVAATGGARFPHRGGLNFFFRVSSYSEGGLKKKKIL
ncbi:hypothetical protein MKW94_024166 [Papaver nudicaule]|uniref:Uncharacterized protein n=1 Tax=Papaver nudicaule TaxID=74823 RepID=A0AA41V927_PAPNU|nr:hypothetical protein [Papaver nudicaule]